MDCHPEIYRAKDSNRQSSSRTVDQFRNAFPRLVKRESSRRNTMYMHMRVRGALARPRMYEPSFQAHPGTPPVGGGATRDRYPSALAPLELLLSRSRGKESGERAKLRSKLRLVDESTTIDIDVFRESVNRSGGRSILRERRFARRSHGRKNRGWPIARACARYRVIAN